ncbi:hypothetical protein JW824_06110 [bacterium]|nr:hypothetical protein [bacterium]
MRRINRSPVFMTLSLILLFASNFAHAVTTRYIRIGRMWAKIQDHGQFAENSGTSVNWYYTKRGFTSSVVRCSGTRLAVKNWMDENGNFYSVKLGGAPYGSADNLENWFEIPHPDNPDLTIVRYFRYIPPTITVNGFTYQDRFPLDGDEVAPSKIPGTAEVMTESYIRTWLGIDIRARSLAWSTKNHDDYIIYDWVFTNTGNVDRDADVELNRPLSGLYIMRQQQIFPNAGNEWSEFYGENISDTSRIMYSTPTRRKADTEDRYGIGQDRMIFGQDQVEQLMHTFVGEGTLFVQKSWDNPVDDPSQPRMHCVSGPDDLAFKLESGQRPESDWFLVYTVMQEGYSTLHQCVPMHITFPEADIYPGTAHDTELPKRGVSYLDDFEWWFWHQVASNASGPFDLPIGESLRYVWAIVGGALKPEIAWDVYEAWRAGTCTWPAWEAGGENDLADLYPTFKDFPEVAPTANDQAKDRWVVSARDSMLKNNYAAQWAVQNDYNVPIAPPPPSIEVFPLPGRIRIAWGTESESAADFAGYRVYRASGYPHYYKHNGIELGRWEKIFEVTGKETHFYDDSTTECGTSYYYYVTAFDNGTENGRDVYNNNQVLESGQYLNMTSAIAVPRRPPGRMLDQIRIVSNPFNISASETNYPGEPNKIMFLDLPIECTIRIYTESLDLIKTIHHYGSGEEAWGASRYEHQLTENGFQVVSGLYIAHFETPEGETVIKKFVIVR